MTELKFKSFSAPLKQEKPINTLSKSTSTRVISVK